MLQSNGVNYFVTGSGGALPAGGCAAWSNLPVLCHLCVIVSVVLGVSPVPLATTRAAINQFSKASTGVLSCAATSTAMTCSFLDGTGATLYSTTIPARTPMPLGQSPQEQCYPNYLILKENDAAYTSQLINNNPPPNQFITVVT